MDKERWVIRMLWVGVAAAMIVGWDAGLESTRERASWAILVFTCGWAAGGAFALGRLGG